MVLRYALCAVIAYLLGNFTTGVYVTKWFSNLDIRKVGSGNPGTTNVLRTLGWLPSALTLLGDVLKGLLGGWIGYWIAGEMGARIGGAFAVAGHNWPMFAKFKGGKGIAASLVWPGLRGGGGGGRHFDALCFAGLHLRRDFLFCHHLHMPLGGVVEHRFRRDSHSHGAHQPPFQHPAPFGRERKPAGFP